MTGFAKGEAILEQAARTYYTGVNNFKVIAVNPTKTELEKLYGREIKFDPEYISESDVTDGDGTRKATNLKLDFYLENKDLGLNTKLTFYISNTHHKSESGKLKVINDFGGTSWFSQEDIDSGNAPENMAWFNMSGIKIAKRGEEEVIDFLKNLLNIPMNSDKLTNKSEAHAKFSKEDLDAMFKGKVTLLKQIIDSTNNAIGVLLGVKTKADGGLIQAVYARKTLRQYVYTSSKVDKYNYIKKDLLKTKEAGAYGNVDFGSEELGFREFTITPTSKSSGNLPPEIGTSEEDLDSDWL